jgi:hypothetical protein
MVFNIFIAPEMVVSEPAWLFLTGVLLVGYGSWLRRYAQEDLADSKPGIKMERRWWRGHHEKIHEFNS